MKILLDSVEKQVDRGETIKEAVADAVIEERCKENDILYKQNINCLDTTGDRWESSDDNVPGQTQMSTERWYAQQQDTTSKNQRQKRRDDFHVDS